MIKGPTCLEILREEMPRKDGGLEATCVWRSQGKKEEALRWEAQTPGCSREPRLCVRFYHGPVFSVDEKDAGSSVKNPSWACSETGATAKCIQCTSALCPGVGFGASLILCQAGLQVLLPPPLSSRDYRLEPLHPLKATFFLLLIKRV